MRAAQPSSANGETPSAAPNEYVQLAAELHACMVFQPKKWRQVMEKSTAVLGTSSHRAQRNDTVGTRNARAARDKAHQSEGAPRWRKRSRVATSNPRPSSRDEDIRTGGAVALPSLHSPNRTSSILSLAEYLDQPAMVKAMLDESVSAESGEQVEDGERGDQNLEDWSEQVKKSYRVPVLAPAGGAANQNNELQPEMRTEDSSFHPASSRLWGQSSSVVVLPLLKTMSPRTRQGLARLPPPSQDDMNEIHEFEFFAEGKRNAQNLYQNLKRQQQLQQQRKKRDLLRVLGNHSLDEVKGVSRLQQVLDDPQDCKRKSPQKAPSKCSVREEQIHMAMEDVNANNLAITVPAASPLSAADSVTQCKDARAGRAFPTQSYHHLLHEKESAVVQERDALSRVERTLTEIQHFLPLDVIYACGMGKFASPAQQRATQVLFRVGSRLKSNLVIQAVQRWKDVVAALRFREMSAAALPVQCWWRQLLAVQELKSRRRIRIELQRRQQAMLRVLASKQSKSACIITKAVRGYAHRKQRQRYTIRTDAARRIQRFWRERQAFWVALRIQLRKKQRDAAAVCIQKQVRGRQARVKKNMLRKIRRVELRKALAEQQTRERRREMKVQGAAIAIQRAFRKWQQRRVLSLRRRRAQFEQDKKKILKVQAQYRGQQARKLYIRHLLQVLRAVHVLQHAWRRYRARQIRSNLEKTREEQRKQWREEIGVRRGKQKNRVVPQEVKNKWNQLMTMKEKALNGGSSSQNGGPSLHEIEAAMKVQARWRGIKIRQRLRHEKARACELERRAVNRTRRKAATCIQKRIRGIQGRAKAWEAMVHTSAGRIQSAWRGFRTRRELVRTQKALQAIQKMQIQWRQRRNKESQRLRVRAARHIQGLVRVFLSKRWLRHMVRRQQFLSEEQAMGKVLMDATRRRTKDELLLQSFIYKDLLIVDTKTQSGGRKKKENDDDAEDCTRVDTSLFRIDCSKSLWKRRGYDGIWQEVFRHASGGSAEIDNSRFARFLKALPHAFINKTSFPTQTVDLIFAKMKEPKARTISFPRFNKAMIMVWQEKFAPGGTASEKTKMDLQHSLAASSLAVDHTHYLKFMNQFVLPSTIQNGKFRKLLEDHCTQRILWAVVLLRRFATRITTRKHHDHFLLIHQERLERRRLVRCVNNIQTCYRRYRFRMQMKTMLASMFIEYIDHRGRSAKFKHLTTGKLVAKRPIFLKGVECKKIIPLPFPGEEFHAFCERHEDSTSITGKVPAEVYCVQCEDAMCAICFARDHSKRHAFQVHERRQIPLCSHCLTETATRECLHCGNGHVPFCDACFPHVHNTPDSRTSSCKSSTANASRELPVVVPAKPLDTHRFQSLVVMCIECCARVAQWQCETCQDVYCKRCLSSSHAKGQRQHHQCHRVSYFSVLKQQAENVRLLNEQRELEKRRKQRDEERKRREQEATLRNESAIKIQALTRSFLGRKRGRAYMKLVRQTQAAKAQRVRDDRIRSSVVYKVKNVFGVAPALKSDTKQEVAARQQRFENVKQTLFFHRRVASTDANGAVTRKNKRWTKQKKAQVLKAARSWCMYDVRVKIVKGEWKDSVGSILSTQHLTHTGFVVVFLPLANRSVVVNWEHIVPYDDDALLRQPYEPATQVVFAAAHDFRAKLSQVVDNAARRARLLYLQTIEYHDIAQYAWVVEYNKHEKREEYWNVVLNKRTFDVPRAMELIERMEIEQRHDVEERVAVARSKLLDLLNPFHSKHKKKLALRRNAVVFTATRRAQCTTKKKRADDDEEDSEEHSRPTFDDDVDAMACARFWHERIVPHEHFGGKKATKFFSACMVAPHSTKDCWFLVRMWQWMDLYEADGYEAHAKAFLNLATDLQLYIAGEVAPSLESGSYKEAKEKMLQLLKLKEETLQLLVFNASQQQAAAEGEETAAQT